MHRHASPLLAALALALLAACSSATRTSCTGSSTLCDGTCAELASDNLNCGACGHACALGLLCSSGTCVLECQSGLTACPAGAPTACLDLATDPSSCGTCGHACGTGEACASSTCHPGSCGDGVLNPGEECDAGGTTDSAFCNMAAVAGVHRCQIARCGDGYANTAAGEQCDDGGETAACNANCTHAACGDGVVNGAAGEVCDTGGTGDSASCNMASGAGARRCQIARCGDGYPNAAAGEQCDGAGETATCNADCTFAVCGDGKLNLAAGEQCDLGALNGPAGCCSATCHVNAGFTHCP
jgi:hypothetical protein